MPGVSKCLTRAALRISTLVVIARIARAAQSNPLSSVWLRTEPMKPIVARLRGSWSAGSHHRLSVSRENFPSGNIR
jgi:hypothetical protein